MSEESQSTCFIRCVSSCLGIRRHQPHEHHKKPKQKGKLNAEKLQDKDAKNCKEESNKGFIVQCQVNGKVSTSEARDQKVSDDETTILILTQPPLPVNGASNEKETPKDGADIDCNTHCVTPDERTVETCQQNISNTDSKDLIYSKSSNHTDFTATAENLPSSSVNTDETVGEVVGDVRNQPAPPKEPKHSDSDSDVGSDINLPTEGVQDTRKPLDPCGHRAKIVNGERDANPELLGDTNNIQDENNHAHFRELVNKERARLSNLVTEWTEILSTDISVEVQDEIRSINGQTNLIITERFAQFSSLINRSEGISENCKPDDGKLIKPSDLQGFWDMIFYQVQDVSNKFERLEVLRRNDWDSNQLETNVVVKKTPKKKAVNKGASTASNDKEKARRMAARKRIVEARQRLKEQTVNAPDPNTLVVV